MFGELFETLFPALGEFFGILAGVADIRPSAFVDWLNYLVENPNIPNPPFFQVSYFNVFTGVNGTADDLVHYAFTIPAEFFSQNIFGRLLNVIGSPIVVTFFGPFISLPLWISLPCAFAMWGWLFSVVKFFWNIIVP